MTMSEDYSGDSTTDAERFMKEQDEFWLPIIKPRGQWDYAQIMMELADYKMVIDNVSLVYDHVTGGRLSKPNTLASNVIAEADANYERWADQGAKAAYTQGWEDAKHEENPPQRGELCPE